MLEAQRECLSFQPLNSVTQSVFDQKLPRIWLFEEIRDRNRCLQLRHDVSSWSSSSFVTQELRKLDNFLQIYTNEKAIVVDLATCQVSQIFSDVWQDSVTAQDDLGEIDQVAESHITMKYSEDIGINFDFELEQKIAKFTTSRLGNILLRTEESES